jgi:ribonucleotide reductase beta subunit family protein with ferritin-like domain
VTTADIQLNDPQTLYRHWEDSQWSPFEIDLSTDQRQWRDMDGDGPAAWSCSCSRP